MSVPRRPRTVRSNGRVIRFEPLYIQFFRSIEKTETCWLFNGAKTKAGYGRLSTLGVPRVEIYAHRFSYEIHFGPIPDGLLVCHHCDNPPCVRPDHLFVGTHGDNMLDSYKKGRSRLKQTIPDETVRAVRTRYAQGGVTTVDLAREFGVSQSWADYVVRNKRRRE